MRTGRDRRGSATRPVTRVRVFLAALLVWPTAALAQNQESLAARCLAEALVQEPTSCTQMARAAGEVQGAIGLAGTWGGVLPGAAHSLGKRFADGPPRFEVTGRLGFVSFDLPNGGAGPATSSSSLRPALQAAFGGGVFEGFRARPSVGGVLALDLFGTLSWVSMPASVTGGGVQGGIGARVGLLRESFDVPALALVVSSSWAGESRFERPGTPSAALEVTPRITAIRAAVAKDLGGLGVGLSLGRDWYRGGVALLPPSSQSELRIEEGSFANSRWAGALSAALNYLVLFLEGEVGWAAALSGPDSGNYEPGGQVFGTVSARLIF